MQPWLKFASPLAVLVILFAIGCDRTRHAGVPRVQTNVSNWTLRDLSDPADLPRLKPYMTAEKSWAWKRGYPQKEIPACDMRAGDLKGTTLENVVAVIREELPEVDGWVYLSEEPFVDADGETLTFIAWRKGHLEDAVMVLMGRDEVGLAKQDIFMTQSRGARIPIQ